MGGGIINKIEIFKERWISISKDTMIVLNDEAHAQGYDMKINQDYLENVVSADMQLTLTISYPHNTVGGRMGPPHMRTYWAYGLYINGTLELSDTDLCVDIPLYIYESIDDVPMGREFMSAEYLTLDDEDVVENMETLVEEAIARILEEE